MKLSLKNRILSATVIIASVILGIAFKPIVFAVVLGLICFGLWEFFTMIENKGVSLFKYFGLILGVLIPTCFYFQIVFTPKMQLFMVMIALFLSFVLELTRKETQQVVLSMSATLFGVMYISLCFSFIIRIRFMDHGVWLLAFMLLVAKAQDMGAYFFGSAFGQRPFLKNVSPNKTLEGAIGGIFTSLLTALILGSFMMVEVPYYHNFFIGIILGVVSQLGDLFESLIKRDTGVKDSGKLIPGMGGVLDVIDSLIFTAPVFYFYLTMVLAKIG